VAPSMARPAPWQAPAGRTVGASERDFVIHVRATTAAAAALLPAAAIAALTAAIATLRIVIAAATTALAIAAALTAAIAPVKQRQLAAIGAQHDFSGVAVGTGLILPFAGFKLALDIDLGPLAQILFGYARQ